MLDTHGSKIIQSRPGSRLAKGTAGWYDPAICIKKGEDLLRDYDTAAIPVLRRHQLIWQGWEDPRSLLIDEIEIDNCIFSVRRLHVDYPNKLRLFFLSLLWRCCASDLTGFEQVIIPPDDLEHLRRMVHDRAPRPLSFYPISLMQFSTKGPLDNLGPIQQEYIWKTSSCERKVVVWRLYLNGLIIRFHFINSEPFAEHLGHCALGRSNELVVQTLPYEGSFQFGNALKHFADSYRDWPEIAQKLNVPRP